MKKKEDGENETLQEGNERGDKGNGSRPRPRISRRVIPRSTLPPSLRERPWKAWANTSEKERVRRLVGILEAYASLGNEDSADCAKAALAHYRWAAEFREGKKRERKSGNRPGLQIVLVDDLSKPKRIEVRGSPGQLVEELETTSRCGLDESQVSEGEESAESRET